jgi:hypothetical protein
MTPSARTLKLCPVGRDTTYVALTTAFVTPLVQVVIDNVETLAVFSVEEIPE